MNRFRVPSTGAKEPKAARTAGFRLHAEAFFGLSAYGDAVPDRLDWPRRTHRAWCHHSLSSLKPTFWCTGRRVFVVVGTHRA
eukprot:scaffold279657_cov30-Tisochrysis_lutea.AAC.4